MVDNFQRKYASLAVMLLITCLSFVKLLLDLIPALNTSAATLLLQWIHLQDTVLLCLEELLLNFKGFFGLM